MGPSIITHRSLSYIESVHPIMNAPLLPSDWLITVLLFFFLSCTLTTSCLLHLSTHPPPSVHFPPFFFTGMNLCWRCGAPVSHWSICMATCSPAGGLSFHLSPQTCVSPPTLAPPTPLRSALTGWGNTLPTLTSQRWGLPSCTPAHRPSPPSPKCLRSPCRPPGQTPSPPPPGPPPPPSLSLPHPTHLWPPASPVAHGLDATRPSPSRPSSPSLCPPCPP